MPGGLRTSGRAWSARVFVVAPRTLYESSCDSADGVADVSKAIPTASRRIDTHSTVGARWSQQVQMSNLVRVKCCRTNYPEQYSNLATAYPSAADLHVRLAPTDISNRPSGHLDKTARATAARDVMWTVRRSASPIASACLRLRRRELTTRVDSSKSTASRTKSRPRTDPRAGSDGPLALRARSKSVLAPPMSPHLQL